MLAFGSSASIELQRQGHSYLHSLVPWIVLLIGVAVGGFLHSLGRAMSGQTSAPRFTLSLAALWCVCTVCLIAIYITQELLEGMFLTGHPAGLVGVFGFGGWWAIPVAACIGLVLAAFFHGARWVLEEVARRAGATRERRRPEPAPRPSVDSCSCPASRRWPRGGRAAGRRADPSSSRIRPVDRAAQPRPTHGRGGPSKARRTRKC